MAPGAPQPTLQPLQIQHLLLLLLSGHPPPHRAVGSRIEGAADLHKVTSLLQAKLTHCLGKPLPGSIEFNAWANSLVAPITIILNLALPESRTVLPLVVVDQSRPDTWQPCHLSCLFHHLKNLLLYCQRSSLFLELRLATLLLIIVIDLFLCSFWQLRLRIPLSILFRLAVRFLSRPTLPSIRHGNLLSTEPEVPRLDLKVVVISW